MSNDEGKEGAVGITKEEMMIGVRDTEKEEKEGTEDEKRGKEVTEGEWKNKQGYGGQWRGRIYK